MTSRIQRSVRKKQRATARSRRFSKSVYMQSQAVQSTPAMVFGPVMVREAVDNTVDNTVDEVVDVAVDEGQGKTVVTMAMIYEALTLTNLRSIAVQRGVRGNDMRPSRCTKPVLVAALCAADDLIEGAP